MLRGSDFYCLLSRSTPRQEFTQEKKILHIRTPCSTAEGLRCAAYMRHELRHLLKATATAAVILASSEYSEYYESLHALPTLWLRDKRVLAVKHYLFFLIQNLVTVSLHCTLERVGAEVWTV